MADGEPLQIKIRSSTGEELTFKVKGSTPFQKIFNAFCQKKGLDQAAMRFIFDQQRIRPEQTPAELEMEDGDVIDAMVTQLGGGC